MLPSGINKLVFILIVLSVCLFLTPSPGPLWAANWKFYSANEYFFCFYDPGRIVRTDADTVQVWLKWFSTPEGRKNRIQEMIQRKIPKDVAQAYEYSQVLMEINCLRKHYLILSIADLDDQGRIISMGSKTCYPRELNQTYPIGPDTSENDLFSIVCKGKTP